MSTSILTTKLYIPPSRPNIVFRSRLIERMNEGLHSGHKLTLISAPAGFGKTTLIADWGLRTADWGLRNAESTIPHSTIPNPQLCWLSLDQGDNDPTRFLAYLIAALQTIAPTIGEGVLAALRSPQPPPTESILTTLLNEIATIPDNPSTGPLRQAQDAASSSSGSLPGQGLILVLDDYHVIEAQPVDQALTFLIEHLPPQMHLVIATREDPPLPLARLRVRGQLIELRAADLRFTPGEAATFLNQVMDLDLPAEEVTSLETRTEGWIAGLQLAALSMRGRADVSGFIRAFAGDNRYIYARNRPGGCAGCQPVN